MPECEKHGVPVLIGGDNPPFLVGIGLTDLPTIGPLPPGSGITAIYKLVQGVPAISTHFRSQFLTFLIVLSKNTRFAILTQMV